MERINLLSYVVVGLLLCALFSVSPLRAAAAEDWAARQERERVAQDAFTLAKQHLADARSALELVPQEQRSAEQLNAYLLCALDFFDAKMRYATYAYGEQPYAFDAECERKAEDWPGNPLDIAADGAWRPIKTLSPADAFAPGALVWQYAPLAYYTWNRGWPGCHSFQLSIYGRDEAAAPLEALTPASGNEAWTTLRPGMLALRGRNGPGYSEAGEVTDPQAAARFPAEDAWRRQAAHDYEKSRLQGLAHGANYRRSDALRMLGGALFQQKQAEEARAYLEQTEPRLRSGKLLRDYLQLCGWQVYESTLAAWTFDVPGISSLDDLRNSPLVDHWPLNPFNGWQPMLVVDLQNGFSAGDLVWQPAPMEFNGHGVDMLATNFVLSVYGPTPDYQPGNLAPIAPEQQSWALSPAGSAGNYTAFSSEVLTLTFNRALAQYDPGHAEMRWLDGSPRRLPRTLASARISASATNLAAATASGPEPAEALNDYERTTLQSLYLALELYKYEQGDLPADLTALGQTDYLDVWPGDPVAALQGKAEMLLPASWPALKVLDPADPPQPGCLVYEPGVTGSAPWVQQSLRSPLANPALAYRLSIYGADVSHGPLASIEAPALTYLQFEALRNARTVDEEEALMTSLHPDRHLWPAGWPRN